MIATIVVLMATVAALAWWLRRRRSVGTLAWPETIGLQKQAALVERYLKQQGWDVFSPPGNIRVKVATKPGQHLRLFCLPSLVEYHGAAIKDLAEEALNPGPRPLIGITASAVPFHLRSLAAGGEVLLLYYKNLDLFAVDKPDTAGTLKTMCTALLERKEASAGPRTDLFR